MQRTSFLILAALLLTSCNLAAQLLGGTGGVTYTASYRSEGLEHTLTAKFTVGGGKVTALEITPGALSGAERARQLAFSANVRRYVLEREVSAITLPDAVGEEQQITRAFDEQVIAKLKQDAG